MINVFISMTSLNMLFQSRNLLICYIFKKPVMYIGTNNKHSHSVFCCFIDCDWHFVATFVVDTAELALSSTVTQSAGT